MARRSFDEEMKYIRRLTSTKHEILHGFVPNMRVPAYFYVNAALEPMMREELQAATEAAGVGGFLPAVKQIANVASLPGIVGASIGLPDTHSGYGFAIGNVAGFDMDDPAAVVSPGGVGFDINVSRLQALHRHCHTAYLRSLHSSHVRAVLYRWK